ncbi:MlaA family lipoprotein [Paraglaciecola sp.]|uniref:MlaA family lipoprotein n=1 Tax=Paraglaciecola sp. TaxID=1920173 RepID=UPI003EF81BD5
MNRTFIFGFICAFLLLTGCASTDKNQQQVAVYEDPKDPFEPVNRALWDFNYDVLDEYILRPVTIAYVDYMPQFARTGLLNAAENLEEPSFAINNLLQGKLDGTFISLGRFLLNSTVGLLGTIDVASEIGLQTKEEEFGEVLGKWGVQTGPYLMIPAMGPSDVRSSVGDVVDSAYSPIDSLNLYLSVLRTSIKAIESRASIIEQEQQLANSTDPYAFVKSAYFQNLEYKVNDGEVEQSEEEAALDDDLDAFLDDL